MKTWQRAQADVTVPEEWKKTVLSKIFEQYLPSRIYNVDETALFYHATPEGSLTFAKAQLIVSKKAMDCMTLLCCTNMSEDDKHPLLIGKSKKLLLQGKLMSTNSRFIR